MNLMNLILIAAPTVPRMLVKVALLSGAIFAVAPSWEHDRNSRHTKAN